MAAASSSSVSFVVPIGTGTGSSSSMPTSISTASSSVVPPPPDPGEAYEALVRARPVRRQGVHEVCSSGHLQWCRLCRHACHDGGRQHWPSSCSFEAVRATFAGEASRIQLPHDVVFIRGAVFCLKCGACSTKRLFKLGGPICRPSSFGLKELKRVLGGHLPSNLDRWPLASVERGEPEGPLGPPAPARRRRCRAKTTPPTTSSRM